MSKDLSIIPVEIATALGTFVVDIHVGRALITASNFLTYVDHGLFDGSSFFRIVTPHNQPENEIKISVIQGGLKPNDPRCLAPIDHEPTSVTGMLHEHGTISMARPKNGSGSCSFFICIGNQPELDYGGQRYDDHLGFAAFGRVSHNMNVVEAIFQRSEKTPYLEHEIDIIRVTRQSGG